MDEIFKRMSKGESKGVDYANFKKHSIWESYFHQLLFFKNDFLHFFFVLIVFEKNMVEKYKTNKRSIW